MTKLNMTSELFVAGGFTKPTKNLFENNYEREKGSYLHFHKLYDSTWVVTTFSNKTPRDTIFIYDPFREASYRENLNEIKYPLTFLQDCCDLMSQPFLKVNFVDELAVTNALAGHFTIIFAHNCRVLVFKN